MTAERDDALERERQFCQRRLGEMSAQFEEQMVSLRRCQAAAAAAELEEAGQRDRRAVSRLEVELGESSRVRTPGWSNCSSLLSRLRRARCCLLGMTVVGCRLTASSAERDTRDLNYTHCPS